MISAAGFIATSTLGWSPGREDVARGEVDLEGGHAVRGAGRRADLGREVGQRGQVVADHGGRVGEAAAGELHAITGVAGKADDYAILLLEVLFICRAIGRIRV